MGVMSIIMHAHFDKKKMARKSLGIVDNAYFLNWPVPAAYLYYIFDSLFSYLIATEPRLLRHLLFFYEFIIGLGAIKKHSNKIIIYRRLESSRSL